MSEAQAKLAAAQRAAEEAASSWRRSSAGRWPEISVTALANLVLTMGTVPGLDMSVLEPAWRRNGHQHYFGALYQYDDLLWTCTHLHGGKEEAMACAMAEARERQEERQSVG